MCCILQKGPRSQLRAGQQLLTTACFNHSAQARHSCFCPCTIRVAKSRNERFQTRKKSAVLFPTTVQADSGSVCCRHSFGGIAVAPSPWGGESPARARHQEAMQDRFLEVFALQHCGRQFFPKLVGKIIQFAKHTGGWRRWQGGSEGLPALGNSRLYPTR